MHKLIREVLIDFSNFAFEGHDEERILEMVGIFLTKFDIEKYSGRKKSSKKVLGAKYHVFRDGNYLGIAKWVDDPNIGESFIQETELEIDVVKPDEWYFA